MFGVIRPCRHGMCSSLFKEWTAHLCGLCLTLRKEHGQAARLVTNYDGLLISVLTEAQRPGGSRHRTAGPCALRGMRTADVVDARDEGARLAAAVSLLLAAGKTRDHVADGDGAYARRPVAAAAGRLAGRWDAAGGLTGAAVGFDPEPLRSAVARQAELEATPGLGLLELTGPTELAVAAAFAHTAVLAGRPGNAEPLAEAGRFFGRLAHLIDAVEDHADDLAAGAFNPLIATGTTAEAARRHCDDALHGLRLALAELELDDPRLVNALLDREARRSVDRIFAGHPYGPGPQQPYGPGPHQPYGPGQYPPQQPYGPGGHPPQQPYGPGGYPPGRPARPPVPIPCFTGTLSCATCGLWQPKWSKWHGRGCDDRCHCTRHSDGGNGCSGCCDCAGSCCKCDCCCDCS